MASGPERDPSGPRRDPPSPPPSPIPARRGPSPTIKPLEDFVVTAAKFVPIGDGLKGKLVLSIKRNLPLSTKVAEFHATHVTRSSNAGPFAYHGGDVWKGGNEAGAAKPVFEFEISAQPIYTKNPDGTFSHPGPVSAQAPAWIEIKWKRPLPENTLTPLPVHVIKVTV